MVNTFDELIPADTQEALKNKFDLVMDIYSHTERRVLQNQKKIVDLHNEQPEKGLKHQDAKVKHITDQDFSFPSDYQPNTIEH